MLPPPSAQPSRWARAGAQGLPGWEASRPQEPALLLRLEPGDKGLKACLASSNLCPLASCLRSSFFPALFLPSALPCPDQHIPSLSHSNPRPMVLPPARPPIPVWLWPEDPSLHFPSPRVGRARPLFTPKLASGPSLEEQSGERGPGMGLDAPWSGSNEPLMRGEEIHGL